MTSNKIESMFSLCTEQASRSPLMYRIGCIATYGGKIICKDCNSDTYSTDKFLKNTCTCHAEVNVLRRTFQKYQRQYKEDKIKKIFRKTTLYISRLSNGEAIQNSAPCVDCLTLIRQFNIKRIVFYNGQEICFYNPYKFETTHISYGKLYINEMMKN